MSGFLLCLLLGIWIRLSILFIISLQHAKATQTAADERSTMLARIAEKVRADQTVAEIFSRRLVSSLSLRSCGYCDHRSDRFDVLSWPVDRTLCTRRPSPPPWRPPPRMGRPRSRPPPRRPRFTKPPWSPPPRCREFWKLSPCVITVNPFVIDIGLLLLTCDSDCFGRVR